MCFNAIINSIKTFYITVTFYNYFNFLITLATPSVRQWCICNNYISTPIISLYSRIRKVLKICLRTAA